jgi:hypothetical protein
MKDADRILAALAATQHGAFSREQAYEHGFDRWAISRRQRDGLLIRMGTNSFGFAGTSVGWYALLSAGLLDLGDGAVIAGRAAVALHGLDGSTPGTLEFYVPRAHRRRRTTGLVRSGPELALVDRCRIDGLAVVTATMAIIQLAADGTRDELTNAIDSGVRLGRTTPDVLRRRLAAVRYPGRPGLRLLDDVLLDAGVQSWLERRFLRLVRSAGLPTPAVQQVYRRGGRHVARVDFDFAPWPVIVEVGGQKGYLTTQERQRQERRRNQLQLMDKIIYFFTYQDITADVPYVIDTLRTALSRAS